MEVVGVVSALTSSHESRTSDEWVEFAVPAAAPKSSSFNSESCGLAEESLGLVWPSIGEQIMELDSFLLSFVASP